MKREYSQKKFFHYNNHHMDILIGSLIALCFIMLPNLLSLDTSKTSLQIALGAFAIAIPTLSSFFLTIGAFHLSNNSKKLPLLCMLMVIVGSFAAFVGLISAFWYVSPITAFIFFLAFGISSHAFFTYEDSVLYELQNKNQTSEEKSRHINKTHLWRNLISDKLKRVLVAIINFIKKLL